MVREVNIGGKQVTLNASVWTWAVYKQLFHRPWHGDVAKAINSLRKAAVFGAKYEEVTAEAFAEMTQAEQDEYWQGLAENCVDMEFYQNAIYAMAVAGGYKGNQASLFDQVVPSDLAPGSELIDAFNELCASLDVNVKNVKKNKVTSKGKT